MKYLVIVESPSKCEKVKKYLSKSFPKHSFNVLASVGHFMHLSKKNMGINIKKNFEPNFIAAPDKKNVISGLKVAAKKADKIIIASDLDAEGEKIGYDCANLLKMNLDENNRMIFNEITEAALKKAFENPTKIDMNLVHAQFARRILDRLIGFEISKITAKEIQRGVSAGRVLSVTTKIIYDKEKELEKKSSDTFFQVYGDFKGDDFYILNSTMKKEYKTEKELDNLFKKLQKANYKIISATENKKKSSPPLPFITSTINQASPYGIKSTSGILQKLYQKGFITYIRTDSTKMSEAAKGMIKKYVTQIYGASMFQYRKFDTKKVKGAQEAHECIRPTKMERKPEDIKDPQHRKIYELIWKRSMACLMKDAEYNSKDIKIKPSNISTTFNKIINKYTFLGWKQLYTTLKEANEESTGFENIKKNKSVDDIEINAIQKYNSTTGRYTESKLVNTLEKMGIGRPSTYATAVSNIQSKMYVQKNNINGEKVKSLRIKLKNKKVTKSFEDETINSENNKLIITDLGKIVTEFLNENFNVIMNYNFTADIEQDLDKIQNGNIEWYKVVEKYYNKFHPQVEKHKENLKKSEKKIKTTELIGKYKGKNFYRFQSPFGPRIMYGEKGESGTLYLTPIGELLLSNITLQDAISLLPRTVGKYENNDIVLHYSKNLYIKWNGKNVPLHWSVKKKLKKDITLEDAIMCIEEFKKKKSGKNQGKSIPKSKKEPKVKSMTVAELKKEAKKNGIKGYTKMKKNELLQALRKN
jgi:DNA topoisomerase-1